MVGKQPCGEAHVENCHLLLTASASLQATEWVTLETGRAQVSLNNCRPSDMWLQSHERPQSRTAWLRCSQIFDPHTVWKMINVYCCFKLLSFRVICCVGIDYWFNTLSCVLFLLWGNHDLWKPCPHKRGRWRVSSSRLPSLWDVGSTPKSLCLLITSPSFNPLFSSYLCFVLSLIIKYS